MITRYRGCLGPYLATALCARFPDEGMGIVLALLAAQRTGSPAQGAFVLTAWTAPHVVAAPLVGGFAERARRPRLFYAAALAVFAAAIGALALTLGRTPLAVPLAVALTGGACGPVVTGGLSSLVAVLVPEGPRRARAYALDAVVYNVAALAAPAAVAVTAGALSPASAAVLLMAVAACAVLLVPLLPLSRASPVAATPAGSGPAARFTPGLTALWRVPELRAVTGATALAFLGIGGLPVVAVLFASAHGNADAGGLLMTAFALGALGGSALLARRAPPLAPHRLATVSLLWTGTGLACAAWAPSVIWALPLFALAGVGDGPLLSTTLRIRADHAPEGLRTQVFTLGAGVKLAAASVGTALTGALSHLDPRVLLLATAALQLVAARLAFAGAARGARRR